MPKQRDKKSWNHYHKLWIQGDEKIIQVCNCFPMFITQSVENAIARDDPDELCNLWFKGAITFQDDRFKCGRYYSSRTHDLGKNMKKYLKTI